MARRVHASTTRSRASPAAWCRTRRSPRGPPRLARHHSRARAPPVEACARHLGRLAARRQARAAGGLRRRSHRRLRRGLEQPRLFRTEPSGAYEARRGRRRDGRRRARRVDHRGPGARRRGAATLATAPTRPTRRPLRPRRRRRRRTGQAPSRLGMQAAVRTPGCVICSGRAAERRGALGATGAEAVLLGKTASGRRRAAPWRPRPRPPRAPASSSGRSSAPRRPAADLGPPARPSAASAFLKRTSRGAATGPAARPRAPRAPTPRPRGRAGSPRLASSRRVASPTRCAPAGAAGARKAEGRRCRSPSLWSGRTTSRRPSRTAPWNSAMARCAASSD